MTFIFALLVSVAGFANDSWQVVDHYTEFTQSIAYQMAEAPNGDLYAIGHTDTREGLRTWLVRKSSDGGKTWFTMDNFVYEPGNSSNALSIVIDKSGSVFVGGFGGKKYESGTEGQTREVWLVRKSSDGGVTWKIVDSVQLPSQSWAMASGALIDKSGAIYFLGSIQDGYMYFGSDDHKPHYLVVRKSTDGGATWTTALNQVIHYVWGSKIAQAPSGEIFITATAQAKKDTQRIFVMKANNRGENWQVMDNFAQIPKDSGSLARGLFIDQKGYIYVSGITWEHLSDNKLTSHWLVRKSEDGGKSWIIIDDYYTGTETFTANNVFVRNDGSVFVVGYGYPHHGSDHWIVRKFQNGTWETSDDFSMPERRSALGLGLFEDSKGSLFSLGSGNLQWLIKKL